MKIQTTRFGEVEIQEGEILTLPNGMLGFTSDQHFAMLEDWTRRLAGDLIAYLMNVSGS